LLKKKKNKNIKYKKIINAPWEENKMYETKQEIKKTIEKESK
jgi:hypothetical protein